MSRDPDIVVFLGPTLKVARARQLLDAVYAPPAEQGSIVSVVQSCSPKVIVLIDGVFGHSPAVRHKEILWALSCGVKVIGCSSIGALRAAELHKYGMSGHGFIYRWYRATTLADDDEVAVAMTPVEIGSEALSDALINIRLTLSSAIRSGLIPREMGRALEEIARTLYFRERTYALIFEEARCTFPKVWCELLPNLEAWTIDNAVDQKAADARSLLLLLRSDGITRLKASSPYPFQMTESWLFDLQAAGLDTSVEQIHSLKP